MPSPRPAAMHRLSVSPDVGCASRPSDGRCGTIIRAPARSVGIAVAIGLHLIVLAALLGLRTPRVPQPRDTTIQMVFEPAPLPSLKSAPPLPPMPAASLPAAAPAIPAPPADLPPAPVWHHLGAMHDTPASRIATRPAVSVASPSSTEATAPAGHATGTPPATAHEAPDALRQTPTGCDAASARYPASARVMHEQGLARVRLTIRPGGTIADARIDDSSGFDDLDDAALAAARGLTCRNPGHADADVTLPVRFTLH